MSQVIPIKTVSWCAYQALFRLVGATPAKELAWLEQTGIDWLSQRAPIDNYGRVVTKWFKVSNAQREFAMPKSAIRMLYVGMEVGGRTFSLTLDPNIAVRDEVQFSCDPLGGGMDSVSPISGAYAPFRTELPYNVSYYKIQNGIITFNPPPPNGNLYMSWLEGGGGSPDTIVHAGYIDALRLYLSWQYCERKSMGSAEGGGNQHNRYFRMAKDYERQYDEAIRNANTVTKTPSIGAIMDTLRGLG